jgi:hypothetical protein
MMITRGVNELYLASLQDDDYSWSKEWYLGFLQDDDYSWFFYSTSDHHPVRTPGTIILLHEYSSSYKDARYLQDDDHCWSNRMVPAILTE